MKTRRRTQSVREITGTQVEEVIGKYADAHYKHKEITAQMEQEITNIRDQFAPKLEVHKKEMDGRFQELQLWAETNDEAFAKRKSKAFSHGIIGFRTGTPKTKLLKGFTWKSALELMRNLLPDYIITKETPNKERLIADREQLEKQEMFKKIGVEVVQEETFFVEVNEEETAAV